jgi:3-oxoacyl-[acyl-carrier-protein] synthase II
MSRRVVVTGLGALTPIGKNVSETWTNALAGKSGIVKINQPWSEGLAAQIAGLVEWIEARN